MLGEPRRRGRVGALGAIALLLAVGSSALADGQPPHPIGQAIRNITYCSDQGVPQQLDLLYPKVAVTYPRPVVLWVHGGTWVAGSKDGARSVPYVRGLREAGFIVAAMDYSLAPARKFPAQTQDLTCGVRFLRANAAQYDIDPDHIGAMGGSAGGHLVQMLGVNDGSDIFDGRTSIRGRAYRHYSSDVQAVASLWGVSDLTRNDLNADDIEKLPEIFGKPKKWPAASPINYVRKGLPPFLLVHGNHDTDVRDGQSKQMYRALVNVKVPATLVIVKDAEHGLKPAGGTPSPSVATVVAGVEHFFKSAFKRSSGG